MRLFENRVEAANELARHLAYLRGEEPIILALGNDGVVVGEIVARALNAPLDVLLIERLTAPSKPGQVVGVVDEFGRISMIESTARWHQLSSQQMIEPAREAFGKLQRKRGLVRAVLPSLEVLNRTVIVVSEGVGVGARMLGAIASTRDRGARKVIAAAPAGASNATWQLHDTADQVVIPHRPTTFKGVEHFYQSYTEVSNDLMLTLLRRWIESRPDQQQGVQMLLMKLTTEDQRILCCEIDLPPGAGRGSGPFPAVIFAHGFESDARSHRTIPISQRLAKRGVIGVRLDFTGHGRSQGTVEEATYERMMKDLRLVHQNVARLNEVDAQRIGLNGSGTGGMIVLHYAAKHPEIQALVIRGPICGEEVDAAKSVKAPTLLVHAEHDTALCKSVEAMDRALQSTHELLRITDSNRLFSDPISRELMIDASVHWLADHLLTAPTGRAPVAEPTESSAIVAPPARVEGE